MKDLLFYQVRENRSWYDFGDPELKPVGSDDPDRATCRYLRAKVAELNGSGPHQDQNFDGVLRVLLFRGEYTELHTMLIMPDRWPDAMAVYRKPDDSILQAAVNAAAPYFAPYMAAHHNLQAASHYDAALRVAKAVLEAHDELIGTVTRISAADMISTAASLLPDYR